MTFDYIANYDSAQLRGVDDSTSPRPWDLAAEIKAYAGPEKRLLDIGCGTAFKLIPLAPYFKEIVGLDVSKSMLNSARQLLAESEVGNVTLVEGSSYELPFEDQEFDMVTCMLSRWSVKEIHRVLKPNGVAIIEHIGCEDKKEFKVLFGKDDLGWRGQFLDYQKDMFLEENRKAFSEFFNNVKLLNGFWYTFYTERGLLELLRYTPTVRGFDYLQDQAAFQKAMKTFTTPQGIRLQQNRILIFARNI